jgi:4-aminobutyrate aminotransferase
VKYHTKRDKLIAFNGSFHGRTMGALSLTASRSVQRKGFGTLLSGVFHMPYPDTYRGTYGVNPQNATADCLSYLENELFRRRVDPEEVAGIFIEPIQGEGGYILAPADFLLGLQQICRKYGILLVTDEVQSGMGRTGKWWAVDHAEGVEPDIICTAKGIASGMPLSAVIARASVMDWKPGAHASTFGGNPVCIAASLATLRLLEAQYMERAKRVGEFIMKRTADWTQRFKNVGEVRGRGLMIGIELVLDQKTKEKAPEMRNRIIQAAYRKGLLILGSGDTTVRFCPPLVIDEEQAEFAVKTLEECFREEEAK